jgi:predicted nucleic acid-binding protein
MILVDSDIIIWVLRGDQNVKKRFEELATETDGLLFITPVQLAEIYSGIREKERAEAELFLDSLLHLPLDDQIGKTAGEFINRCGKSHAVTLADAFIAAAAKTNNLRMWTLNKKHYPMLAAKDFIE